MHVFFMGSTGCLMCFSCLKKLSFALFGERFIGRFLHYSSSKSAKTRNEGIGGRKQFYILVGDLVRVTIERMEKKGKGE